MGKLLRRLTENWKLKLLALALTVLLWVVVSAEQMTSSWIPVPLVVEVTDPNFQLISESVPREVEVRFLGPGREFLDLAVRRPPLVLTVSEIEDSQQLFQLDPRDVRLPNELEEVTATGVNPGFVRLRFRETATRVLPVRVDVASGPGSGWSLVDGLRVRPAQVQITGLTEQVADLDALSTVPISIPSGDSVFSRVVPIDTVGLSGARLSARQVRVSGRVERVVDRQMEGVPVSVGPGVRIQPTRVVLRLRGPRSAVEGVRTADLRVAMAIDSIPSRVPDEGTPVPLRVQGLPPGVTATVRPPNVQLLPARMILDTVPTRPAPQQEQDGEEPGEAQ